MNLNARVSIPISPDRPIEVGGHQALYVPEAYYVMSRTTTSMLIFALSEKLTPFKPPWFSHVVWEPFGQLLPWLLRLYYVGNKWSTEACLIHMPWSQLAMEYPFLQALQVLALQVFFTLMCSITNLLFLPLSQRIWLGLLSNFHRYYIALTSGYFSTISKQRAEYSNP